MILDRAFAPVRRVRTNWRKLEPFLAASKRRIVLLATVSTLAAFAEAGLLVVVAQIALAISDGSSSTTVDIGPLHDLEVQISALLVVAAAIIVARSGLLGIAAWLPAKMSSEVQASFRTKAINGYLSADWPTQAAQREGHLQDVVTTYMHRSTQVVLVISQVLSSATSFAALMLSALVVSPLAATGVAAASVVLFFVLRPISRIARRQSHKRLVADTEFAESINESVRLAEEIRVLGASSSANAAVEAIIERAEKPNFRAQLLDGMVRAIYQNVALGLIIIGLAVVYLVGTSEIAALGAVVLMLIRGLGYSSTLQSSYHKLSDTAPYISRMTAELKNFEQHRRVCGDRTLARVDDLRFVGVDYAYRAGVDVLHDVTFSVRRGEAIGVVGPSGAGKSTLVQLLLRLREPTSGAYLVNGEPAGEFLDDDWTSHFTYVPQDSHLLHSSVSDNIRFHRAGVSDEAIVDAARRAHIHDDIVALPDGYDTPVGQRASTMSGGQQQRICLARALAGNPSVMVLDEPTSALDVQSEALVQESLRKLRGDVTLFVIAHRLSTLSICDRIMVFEGGHLTGFAPAEDLRSVAGFFQEASELSELR